ncbi:hypothetical protein Mgra_00009885 [Meloidogyne graminicola]|uniref:Kringle-like domain-containing protein n=1 Tax=Meloidogyne graminicola TaxID=189291 RepID=A0A8S9Z8A9_9BILA|nr:hypothetical protein Mgra_00009885 [Meloidogyne graminicola]
MSHNYCRFIPLDLYEYNKALNNATFHLFQFTSQEWKYGPWCYVQIKSGRTGRFRRNYKNNNNK